MRRSTPHRVSNGAAWNYGAASPVDPPAGSPAAPYSSACRAIPEHPPVAVLAIDVSSCMSACPDTAARRYSGTPVQRRAGIAASPPNSSTAPCPSACHYVFCGSAATMKRHRAPVCHCACCGNAATMKRHWAPVTPAPRKSREVLPPGAVVCGAPNTESRRIVCRGAQCRVDSDYGSVVPAAKPI
jgi:hypothetical protein